MKRRTIISFLCLFFMCLGPVNLNFAYAQEDSYHTQNQEAQEKEKESATKESRFQQDFAKMRDILIDGAGNKPLLRGMLLPLFQPVFIAVMLAMGLWASQLSDRLTIIWSIPSAMFLGLVVASFIATFHPEWKPDLTFQDEPLLPDITSIQVTAIFSALVVGALVAANKSLTPPIDIALAGFVGLMNGFTQNAIATDGNIDSVIFWIGFGMTGLIFSIIGIGFETFLRSLHLSVVVKFLGILTVLMSLILAINVF